MTRDIVESQNSSSEQLDGKSHPGSELKLPYGFGPVDADDEKVFFFDIDNCLYPFSYKVQDLMQEKIREYISRHLNLTLEDATNLHLRYYREYGLAIQGLAQHHKIDALQYNREVDDALPLEKIFRPDSELREMLLRLRKSGKVKRFWLFTNAYKNHAIRVVKLLQIADLFDGMTFCDYGQEGKFICKPDPECFHKALKDAGVCNTKNAYFVDDSYKNCKAALELGFSKVVNVVEDEEALSSVPQGAFHVKTIHQLPEVVPELFD